MVERDRGRMEREKEGQKVERRSYLLRPRFCLPFILRLPKGSSQTHFRIGAVMQPAAWRQNLWRSTGILCPVPLILMIM